MMTRRRMKIEVKNPWSSLKLILASKTEFQLSSKANPIELIINIKINIR
jgi:hypothetical protein